MLISSEIKKLSLIRFVSVTFLLIFLLNGILCFVEARRSESENAFDSDTLSRVYEAYAADPDGVRIDDPAQGDDGDLGGAAADVDNH